MQYLIIERNDPEELEDAVDIFLNKGWILQGGIALVVHQVSMVSDVQMLYLQAMYHES